jgi:hypothetical protein
MGSRISVFEVLFSVADLVCVFVLLFVAVVLGFAFALLVAVLGGDFASFATDQLGITTGLALGIFED